MLEQLVKNQIDYTNLHEKLLPKISYPIIIYHVESYKTFLIFHVFLLFLIYIFIN